MIKGILDRLAEGPVLGDGGYLLELEKRGYVQAGPFTPEVVIEHPSALAELHREFLRAGAEVLQTMTFYEPDDAASADHVRGLLDRQLQDQLDAGPPDFWIGETFSYLGEALLFVERAKRTGLPVMVTLSFETLPAKVYEGESAAAAAKRLADAGADVVGVNCLNAPAQQLPIALAMVDAVGGAVPVASQPVAFGTTDEQPDFTAGPAFPYGLTPTTLARGDLARFAEEARDGGVRYIGSCCGSVAEHVRAMAKVLGKLPEQERGWRSTSGKAMSAYEYHGHDETEV